MKKIIFVYFIFLASILSADEIFLTDGKTIKGTVVNVTIDSVEYSVENGTSEKLNRGAVMKVVYESGREIDFYDRILLKDGSGIYGKVIRIGELYIEYKPSGKVPYDRVETANAARITYDSGKIEDFVKTAETDMVYLKNGKVFKARDIIINERDIEFFDEAGRKQFYGRAMILKVVYKNGSVLTPDLMKSDTADVYNGNMFWDLECGWNGYTGLGARIDYRIFDGVSINGGAGLGFWGYRLSCALRYYPEYPYGMAFSVGAAYNTGQKSYQYTEETENASGNTLEEDVDYVLKPVTAINAALSYFWQLGENNRLYVETGYSYAIQKTRYTYTTPSGNVLTKESKDVQDIIAPGGIIFTIGYSFAI